MVERVRTTLLESTSKTNESGFANLLEGLRAEIQVHCYRMLGSLQDAEDLTQETLVRAWQHYSAFQGRGTLRAWVYKIATNACLDALERRSKRLLPTITLSPRDPHQPPEPPYRETLWLDPWPDDSLFGTTPSPEAQYVSRESISLAFLISLQLLPPRQRAALILSDVLDWRAKEVAELLSTTVSSVNSALHRARQTLRRHCSSPSIDESAAAPLDRASQDMLDRFVRAWEEDDVPGLVALLKEDATFSMPPSPSWYRGRTEIGLFLAAFPFREELPHKWRLLKTRANGQPATGAYELHLEEWVYRPCSIQVLTVVGEQIADVTNFKDAALFPRFGLPPELKA